MAGARSGVHRGVEPVLVEDVLQTDVVTAQRDTPVATVAAAMAEEDVGSVVVLKDGKPVDVVTDRTIALAVGASSDIGEQEVQELLELDVVTGTTEMSVFDATRRMREASIRRLPIVDEDGNLAGIVTLDDVLVLLGEELNNGTEIIKEQSPRL